MIHECDEEEDDDDDGEWDSDDSDSVSAIKPRLVPVDVATSGEVAPLPRRLPNRPMRAMSVASLLDVEFSQLAFPFLWAVSL